MFLLPCEDFGDVWRFRELSKLRVLQNRRNITNCDIYCSEPSSVRPEPCSVCPGNCSLGPQFPDPCSARPKLSSACPESCSVLENTTQRSCSRKLSQHSCTQITNSQNHPNRYERINNSRTFMAEAR